MRTEQLEYAAAVARLGSFRRAAEEMHISQPALAETLRNLERELGVNIFERGRSGASVSEVGGELMPHLARVIEAVDALRRAADDQHRASRMIRLATVNAATVPLLTPTIAALREAHPDTQVEVVGAQEEEIDRGLRVGRFDLGLITCLAGDDMPPDLTTTMLLRGRPVVCLRSDSPLADLPSIGVADLLEVPLILMRAGYLMHRFVHRLLADAEPRVSYSTDGAEMGKLMVAQGLGVTLLPDFSVIDDPLQVVGLLQWRPLRDDATEIRLGARRRKAGAPTKAARDLHRLLVERAGAYEAAHDGLASERTPA